MRNEMIFGEDLFDFVSLPNGKKAGRSSSKVFVTEDAVQENERLKHMPFCPASLSEEAEYWKIINTFQKK
jgi:hypothetical protein